MADAAQEVELRDYLRVLRKHLALIVLVVAVAVLTTGLLSYKVIRPSYSAQATLMIILSGSQASSTATNQSLFTLETNLAQTYADMATSRSVLRTAGLSALDAKRVVATAVTGADLLTVQVTAPSAALAADQANAVSRALIHKVDGVVKTRDLSITDPATPPLKATSPRPKVNMAIAAVLGLLVGVALAFLLEYMDTTFRDEEQVQTALGLPVLGVIPHIDAGRQNNVRAVGRSEGA